MADTTTHPLVVHARDDGYFDAGEGPADQGVDVDPRDQVQVQELLSGTSVGATDMNIGIARMQPGMCHIKHHHPDGSEFFYFTKGECWVHVDGEEIRARPGTAIYLPPNCVHAIRNDTDDVVEFVFGLSKSEFKDVGLVYDE